MTILNDFRLDCYKYYASNGITSVWQITNNSIKEFFDSCPGLCSQNYGSDFLLLKHKEVQNLDKDERTRLKNRMVPENVIRHQFLAFLFRVAKDKFYKKNQIVDNTPSSIDMCFKECYLPAVSKFNSHKWRIDRYYNEYVDNVLTAFLPLLEAIFKQFAGVKVPGRKEYLLLI